MIVEYNLAQSTVHIFSLLLIIIMITFEVDDCNNDDNSQRQYL